MSSSTSKKRLLVSSDDSTIKQNKSRLYIPQSNNTTFQMKRVKLLTNTSEITSNASCIIYWMSRDQRIFDNHAFTYAQAIAIDKQIPIKIVFNLVPKFLEATLRQYSFMLNGLKEVEQQARDLNIPFHLLFGDPVINIPQFAHEHQAGAVVTDFQVLRIPRLWQSQVADRLDNGNYNINNNNNINTSQSSSSSSSSFSSLSSSLESTLIPLYQVDAHNIIPCWVASDKLEYSARTIRSKIHANIQEFLTDIEAPKIQSTPLSTGTTSSSSSSSSSSSASQHGHEDQSLFLPPLIDWEDVLKNKLEINRDVTEVDWLLPGYTQGMARFHTFIANGLKQYEEHRNDPNQDVASHLSPYFHFGQISVQKVIFLLKFGHKTGGLKVVSGSADTFIEESVVRRELADNFCYYNPHHYDSLNGAYGWAKETLALHNADVRPVLYTPLQLEQALTHDDLWNAAQIQMTSTGKMHGFLRMYWAKKILEWTTSAEEALRVCIYLNDKYELDGRDANGYVGCMWSIAGIHDQGWGERPIFGKIRFMNYEGCKRKFNVKAFVAKYPPAAANAAAVTSNSSSSSGGGGSSKGTIKQFLVKPKK